MVTARIAEADSSDDTVCRRDADHVHPRKKRSRRKAAKAAKKKAARRAAKAAAAGRAQAAAHATTLEVASVSADRQIKEVDWTHWEEFLTAAVSVMVNPKRIGAIPPPIPTATRSKGTYANPHSQIASLLVSPPRFPCGTQPIRRRASSELVNEGSAEPAGLPDTSPRDETPMPLPVSVRFHSRRRNEPVTSVRARGRSTMISASFAATCLAGVCAYFMV
jgi:hypothetical protein